MGSVAAAHGLSCSKACEIFPEQGQNPCPLHWQVGSYPLHQPGKSHVFSSLSVPAVVTIAAIVTIYPLTTRKWQPTPIFLSGESHGQTSLAGYSPGGCKESDMTEPLSTHCFPNMPHPCMLRQAQLLQILQDHQSLEGENPLFSTSAQSSLSYISITSCSHFICFASSSPFTSLKFLLLHFKSTQTPLQQSIFGGHIF